MRTRPISLALVLSFAAVSLPAQEAVRNWPAPTFWTHPASAPQTRASSDRGRMAPQAAISAALPFVAVAPCRMLDTRTTSPIASGSTRDVALTGAPCGIPSGAAAVSANFAVFDITGSASNGVLLVFPAGSPSSSQALLNWSPTAGQLDNASVVPLGTGGAVTVQPNQGGGSIDLVVDVNGYYGGTVLTSLNTLFGDVTLAAGSNVTITPSGQTLTVAATAGPGGVLPTGTSGQTLRNDGTAWVASSALKNDGTDVTLTGTLALPSKPRITSNGSPFMHNGALGVNNVFLGFNAGVSSTGGDANTGIGFQALKNSTGGGNVAVGQGALVSLTTGNANIAIGSTALEDMVTGAGNIAIGADAGLNLGTGSSNNIYIANNGIAGESNTIRIGTSTVHTGGVIIAGIYGLNATGGTPVYITSGGRIGTITSSWKFKSGIRDIADESDGLMKLRPVAFRYKPEIDPTGATQYGLIAEEVAKVYPDLVGYDRDGQVYTVQYHLVNALLLNEVQKQHRTIEAQEKTIGAQAGANERQRRAIEDLNSRLAKLEARLSEER